MERNSVENQQHFISKFQLSNKTKLFLRDLINEEANKKAEKIIPSNTLIKKYNIVEKTEDFVVSGFIKINENFNKRSLKELGVQINSSSGKLKTITVPINSFLDFIRIGGIEYFEMNQKTDKLNNDG